MDEFLEPARLRLSAELKSADSAAIAFLARLPQFFPVPSAEALSIELRRRFAIDEAARQWVQTGKWPLIDCKETRVLLILRMLQARTFARYLLENDFRRKFANEHETLCWLLVDHWRKAGHGLWKVGHTEF